MITDDNPIRMPVEAPKSAPVATIPQNDPVGQLLAAAQSGTDPAALEKVADVLLKMRAEDARAAWNTAFSEAQAELLPVFEAAEGARGAKFAKFPAVVKAVRPVCSRYGLSFTFTTEGRGDDMMMVCRVRHRLGHVEETRFPCYIDAGMSANDSQKVASASSYAKRYALLMGFGLATTSELDDDAESLTETITEQQAADLEALMSEVGADRARFLAWAGVESIAVLPASWHVKAVKMLEAKRASQ
jgi:hypothetical protein